MQKEYKSPYSQKEIKLVVGDDWKIIQSITEYFKDKEIFVLIDKRINHYYGDDISKLLKDLFKKVVIEEFNPSEYAKLYNYSFPIIQSITENNFKTNNMALIAIGGGTTLNVGGFCASVINKGIPLIVVPTTPMAMSDVAFGSKNSLNTTNNKNVIGTYYDPSIILINYNSLSKLDSIHLKRNSIESLKQFFLLDKSLYEILKEFWVSEIINYEKYFYDVLLPSAEQKMNILFDDPFEKESALVLQWGHLVANSLEVSTKYYIPHDKAVSIGILIELFVLNEFGGSIFNLIEEYKSLLKLIAIEYEHIEFSKEIFYNNINCSKLITYDNKVNLINIKNIGSIDKSNFLISVTQEKFINLIKNWLR